MPLTLQVLPVATQVKNATTAFHAEVEQLLLPKLTNLQSPDDYAVILKMFYGYFLPVENLIQHYITASHLPDIDERRKARTILDDLHAMGYANEELSCCSHLPQIESVPQAFGALYVLEGSTLGGKMIAKMLLKNQHLSLPENATRFFQGYKEETGEKWKSFLFALNQQEDIEPIIATANETFHFLKRWMQHSL